MTEIYVTAPVSAATGGIVRLRLHASSTGSSTELRIDREERLAHKVIAWTTLKVARPTAEVHPFARDMTTIVCELERLHLQGYWLRQRAGGGWRGAWRADLLPPGGARPAVSWEIGLRRPHKELAPLAARLASLDIPAYQPPKAGDGGAHLGEAMRAHGDELRRRHAVDAVIAASPDAPVQEVLRDLDARGLLEPRDAD